MASLAKSAPHAVQHIHFPNESPQYRRARNALLEQEMDLRRQVERVAPSVEHCRPEAKSRRTMFSRRHARAPNRST